MITETPEWLIDDFARETPGVLQVILVSSDGFLLHRAGDIHRDTAQAISAITSTLLGSACSIAELVDESGCGQLYLRFAGCSFLFTAIGELAGLAVLTRQGAQLAPIADRIAHLVASAGRVLTPQRRDEMRARMSTPGAGT